MTPAVARAMQTMLGQLVGERYQVGDGVPTVQGVGQDSRRQPDNGGAGLGSAEGAGIVASQEGSFTKKRRRRDAPPKWRRQRRTGAGHPVGAGCRQPNECDWPCYGTSSIASSQRSIRISRSWTNPEKVAGRRAPPTCCAAC